MIGRANIVMTPDIQEFLHAMHDQHPVAEDKQSMRGGTAGHIPFMNQPKAIKKLLHRLTPAIVGILGHDQWGYTGLWSTRLPKDGWHVKHTHPEGWMSGICYIDVPNNVSGILEFEDKSLPPIPPCTGNVIVFPSDTVHGVSRYDGDKPRLTVAFDLLKIKVPHA